MPTFDFSTYISPFTWRYGSKEMRTIFSEQHKLQLWRKVWISLAQVQQEAGLVSKEELADLEQFYTSIDIERILAIEKETKHDVVAAVKEYAEKATIGGGKIHLGLTSMDVVDNTQVMQMREGLSLIEDMVLKILTLFKEKIETYADTPCLGYTHLQPAQPTTVGYRFAFYAQDLLMDLQAIQFIKTNIVKGKGIKGAVGTQASFKALLANHESRIMNQESREEMTTEEMEMKVMEKLGIAAVDISTQVYSRKIDYFVLTVLASVGSSLAKFAADVRILQSPQIGEWSEGFGKTQVGSSAMPFKKNPIDSEKICSLARLLATYPGVALENASLSYLERTLDDSANKRVIIPEAFLSLDELLHTAEKVLAGMQINTEKIAYNLALYAPFLASEAILMQASKQGADRQAMHEVLRNIAMQAWAEVVAGKPNPMQQLLATHPEITKHVDAKTLEKLFDVSTHIGTAPVRAKRLAAKIIQLTKKEAV